MSFFRMPSFLKFRANQNIYRAHDYTNFQLTFSNNKGKQTVPDGLCTFGT